VKGKKLNAPYFFVSLNTPSLLYETSPRRLGQVMRAPGRVRVMDECPQQGCG